MGPLSRVISEADLHALVFTPREWRRYKIKNGLIRQETERIRARIKEYREKFNQVCFD